MLSRWLLTIIAVSLWTIAAAGSDADKRPNVSSNHLKKTCKAYAQQDGFSVGDFGDVGFDKTRGAWITKMNLQGNGEKFKARCEWTGQGTPRLTVADNGQSVMSRKYSKLDVVQACKAAALANGYEVGDFGDTEFDAGAGVWVSRLMIRKPGEDKYKGSCRWDGRDAPVIK